MEDLQASVTEQRKNHAFPCPSCGNRLIYSPADGALFCAYCKGTVPIDSREVEAPEYLYDPASEVANAPRWEAEGECVHTCPACGAETVTDADDMTLTCPFCGSHYVTEIAAHSPRLRPETMVPHKLPRERADALFAAWVKRRYFAPRAFRRGRHKIEMQGVYLPYFTFDSDLSTSFSGQGGRKRIVSYTVRVNGKTQHRTRTVIDWYPVSGTQEAYFDDAPVCAGGHVDPALLKKVGPFSLKNLNVYNPAYLAGFFAERYTLGLSEGFAAARPQIERRMEEGIRSSLGYDTYRMMSYHHSHRSVRFKHILLPVWISSYRYGGKVYSFLVNGESGKVAGRAPVSPIKVALTVLAGLALAALLFLLIAFTGESLVAAPTVEGALFEPTAAEEAVALEEYELPFEYDAEDLI